MHHVIIISFQHSKPKFNIRTTKTPNYWGGCSSTSTPNQTNHCLLGMSDTTGYILGWPRPSHPSYTRDSTNPHNRIISICFLFTKLVTLILLVDTMQWLRPRSEDSGQRGSYLATVHELSHPRQGRQANPAAHCQPLPSWMTGLMPQPHIGILLIYSRTHFQTVCPYCEDIPPSSIPYDVSTSSSKSCGSSSFHSSLVKDDHSSISWQGHLQGQ